MPPPRSCARLEFGHIVSSPLLRAVQTAEIIANAAAKTVAVDRGLIELDFGSFEGKRVRDLMIQHGKNNAQGLVDMLPADSEPWADVASRAMRASANGSTATPTDEILFVCHDAVMQSMAQTTDREFLQERPRQTVPLHADGGCVERGGGRLKSLLRGCAGSRPAPLIAAAARARGEKFDQASCRPRLRSRLPPPQPKTSG